MVGGGTSGIFGGMEGAQQPMATVNNAIVPEDHIRPIHISIDGDFVGHAMVSVFDIKVLGTNSKQYLIVKLPTKKSETGKSAVSTDTPTNQPSDN